MPVRLQIDSKWLFLKTSNCRWQIRSRNGCVHCPPECVINQSRAVRAHNLAKTVPQRGRFVTFWVNGFRMRFCSSLTAHLLVFCFASLPDWCAAVLHTSVESLSVYLRNVIVRPYAWCNYSGVVVVRSLNEEICLMSLGLPTMPEETANWLHYWTAV